MHPITQMIANQFRSWENYRSRPGSGDRKYRFFDEDKIKAAEHKRQVRRSNRLVTWTGAR